MQITVCDPPAIDQETSEPAAVPPPAAGPAARQCWRQDRCGCRPAWPSLPEWGTRLIPTVQSPCTTSSAPRCVRALLLWRVQRPSTADSSIAAAEGNCTHEPVSAYAAFRSYRLRGLSAWNGCPWFPWLRRYPAPRVDRSTLCPAQPISSLTPEPAGQGRVDLVDIPATLLEACSNV